MAFMARAAIAYASHDILANRLGDLGPLQLYTAVGDYRRPDDWISLECATRMSLVGIGVYIKHSYWTGADGDGPMAAAPGPETRPIGRVVSSATIDGIVYARIELGRIGVSDDLVKAVFIQLASGKLREADLAFTRCLLHSEAELQRARSGVPCAGPFESGNSKSGVFYVTVYEVSLCANTSVPGSAILAFKTS